MADSLAQQLDALVGGFSDASSVSELSGLLANATTPTPPIGDQARSAGAPSVPPTAQQMMATPGGVGTTPAYSLLLDGSITADQIGTGEVGSDQLALLAVLADNLADNSITTQKLQDSAVTTEKIEALAITGDKIAANSIVSGHIATSGLLAEQITAGTLSLGGLDGVPDALDIYDQDGALVGIFDQNGVLFRSPGDTNLQMRFADGVLEFSADGGVNWTTAIDATGITADAIQVGTAPGGLNFLPNSSFEQRPFTTDSSRLWTLAADWAGANTTIAALINIDTSTGDLKMTTVTY